MDDPTEFLTDLSHGLHTPMSDNDAEDLVTALAEMDCSAVDAILPKTSLNSADWADILNMALMEEIHSFESAVSATKNRRELMMVLAATGFFVVCMGTLIVVD